jgi:hypothetical protein
VPAPRPALRPIVVLLAGIALAAAAPTALDGHAAHGDGAAVRRWGEVGHRLIGEAAARHVPAEMPPFFRQAVGQLAYLNPEPDRWRQPRDVAPLDAAMDPAYAPDHYVDLELLPPDALWARDRHAYADSLRAAGVSASAAGFAPYRVLELSARLREEFRLWRKATDPRERLWIEQRILNDAGVLGHYVADLANPAHTSIHHNGWQGDNPKGYTTAQSRPGFHGRFESAFVESHVTYDELDPLVRREARVQLPLRDSVLAYVQRSHGELTRLFDLERQEAFGRETRGAGHERFALERLAAGADMLRDVWWTAWVSSADSAAAPAARQ